VVKDILGGAFFLQVSWVAIKNTKGLEEEAGDTQASPAFCSVIQT